MNETGIRWTDLTWNPIHGCSKTSEGCRNCYAERDSHRWNHTTEPWTVEHAAANVRVKPHKLDEVHGFEGPRWVFVNSMSDLYHDEVPTGFIEDVLDAIRERPESAFQILTKHGPDLDRAVPVHPRNAMLGVSVESRRREYRIEWLREQEASTRFVSFEPLIEPIPDPDLTLVDWAIIGGESGDDAVRREMRLAWARDLVEACWDQDTAVFFKQHSGPRPESRVELEFDDGGGPRRIEEFPELPSGVVPAPIEFLSREVTAE